MSHLEGCRRVGHVAGQFDDAPEPADQSQFEDAEDETPPQFHDAPNDPSQYHTIQTSFPRPTLAEAFSSVVTAVASGLWGLIFARKSKR